MSKRNFTICLRFNDEAKAAAKFYTSIFKDGKIGKVQLYPKEGFEFHQRPEGSIMTVDFIANGQKFTALNGGPLFQFNESISFVVNCKTQKEIDYYWKKLAAQGGRLTLMAQSVNTYISLFPWRNDQNSSIGSYRSH